MKIVSLYAGADNIGDGCFQAGHEVILAVEYNPEQPNLGKDACKTIKLNHPDCEVINKPVSEVLSTLPKCDAVVGGPPCPEFSRVNPNRTMDLCEVNNFKEAVKITKARHYFMENVQDLYQVHRERNFLVNCADYGVPQTRIRRIFTNLQLPPPSHAEFPSNTLDGDPLKKWVSVREALGLNGIIEDRNTVFGEYDKFREYETDKPSNTIVTDSRQWFVSPTGFKDKNKKEITRSIEEPIQTIVNGNEYQITSHKIWSRKYLRGKNPVIYDKHKPNHIDSPFATIASKDRTSTEMITDGKYARKITNEELAILQGFRKDFKFYGGKTSVRKQIGNALPAVISKLFFTGVT